MLLCVLLLLLLTGAHSHTTEVPRPGHTEHARLARWLVHYNFWGSLSTQGVHGGPGAGVASFADGPLDGPEAGRIFFYLTAMDETGQHITEHPDCALSISEAQLHPEGCGTTDPMDPTCARLAIFGRMLPISAADKDMAQQLLFTKHPAMKTWPADHGFSIYELHLRQIHMLDWYGGMHVVSADEYFAAQLHRQQQQQQDSQQQQEEEEAQSWLPQWLKPDRQVGQRHVLGGRAVRRMAARRAARLL